MKDQSHTVLLAVPDEARRATLRAFFDEMTFLHAACTEAASPEAARAALRAGNHDAYLIDAALVGQQGRTLLALADAYDCHAPLLLLLEQSHPHQTIQLLREGAADCLAWQNLDAAGLEQALQFALARRDAAVSRLRTGEKFRSLIENAQDIITIVGPDGTLRYTSPAAERVMGYRPEDLIGKNAFAYIHEDDHDAVFQAIVGVLAAPGEIRRVAYRFRHFDGPWRILESVGSAVVDEEGEASIVVNSRDITEQRLAQERLRESEAKFRELFENSPDAIFVEDLEGIVLDVNPAACRLHDRQREELVGTSVLDLVPPDQRAVAMDFFKQMAGGEIDYLEGYSWTTAGQAVPVELRARRITYARAPALLLHVRDVTERKRAEEALRRSETQNRAIVDALPDALVRLSREGVYLEIRVPRDYAAFVDPEQLLGRCAYEMLPPEVARRARECVEQAVATGEMQTFEYEIQAGQETRVREGRVVRCGEDEVISIQRDITERKRAEEEVKRLKAFYEQVLDDLPADVSVLDPEGRILYLNTSSVRDPEMRQWLLGKTAFDYCRRRNLDLEIARRRHAFVRRAVEEKRIVRFEEALRNRAGGLRHILRMASPVIDAHGRVVQVIGYGLDITDRKQAEEALRKSEALLRTVVTNVPVMLFAFDEHGVVTLAEGKGLQAFDLDTGELVGRSAYDFDDHFPGVRESLDRTLAGEAFSSTLEAEGYAFEYWCAPLTGPDDRIRGGIAVAADVTEMKRSEQELKRSREQLRELALHLQSVREEERTRISREVHDQLGQSLTALRMDVSWLEKGLLDEQTALSARIETMKTLIDQTVRTVRRIATDLRPGILDDLGLAAALEWQTQDFAARTGLRCVFTNESTFAELDRHRSTAIFRVFQEILTNVARHAEASRVDVRLRTEQDELVLAVKDNGRGIEDLDTVHSNSLGMLGMRERTQAWGGRVAFSSAPGAGTEVTMRIPLPALAEA